jgi:hypothetical protein
VVNLVASPASGYRFVNSTGNVDSIADVNAATSIITMGGDYSIAANFEEKRATNWPLIGGIIAGVVAVGLVILFVRKRGEVQCEPAGKTAQKSVLLPHRTN